MISQQRLKVDKRIVALSGKKLGFWVAKDLLSGSSKGPGFTLMQHHSRGLT